ncbi:MAG: hypothetical protein IPJ48_12300 [Propionivibrio sp.]|uniref:DUF4124 domain-containing protein n=1 Tax=Candidatus Propionivibrio dominans TaxID=2954373 RepID=A0A9D7I959_9RHOO|nr:hypothetical protein [Candidatus Propionivibrio dominans]MBL0167416.1 hypothetical protein [Propionivibrio sp.]
MPAKALLLMLLAFSSGFALAQGGVYESKGKDGPVFSDQPSSGAKPLDLPPLNVIEQPQQQQFQMPDAAPAPYSQLTIVSPADGSTIHTNTGAFDMQLQVDPGMRIRRGDTLRVKLDGNPLAQGYTALAIHITEADWASAATSDNVQHSLQAAIISNKDGSVLIESAPVRFFAHRAAVGERAR